MQIFKIILFLVILILPANANTIFNLIKIPNLEIYDNKSENGIKYLKANKPFNVGIRNNSVTCLNSNKETIDEKFNSIKKNFDRYDADFLYKINLKYIVFCENLQVSGINSAGVPNQKMRTLIIDLNFDENHFERVLHHEVFHIINESYKKYFLANQWKSFNNAEFNYAKCSTCSERLNLNLFDNTEGFLTEYSMSTASEDMAEIFSFLMTDITKVKEKALKDPILNKKISFIKENIFKIDNKFIFN